MNTPSIPQSEIQNTETSAERLQTLIESADYQEKVGPATHTALRMIAAKRPLPAVQEAVTRSLVKNKFSADTATVLGESLIATAQKRLSASDAQTIMLTTFLAGQQCLIELAESIITPEEEIVTWMKASHGPPFLVRIIPFIPNLITRGKDYLIVVTNERLLIARLTKPLNVFADPKIKEVVVQAPLASVTGATLDSGLQITFRDGQLVRFSKVSEDDSAELVNVLRSASASGPTAAPVITRHRSILRMLIGSVIGLIALIWSLTGISNVFTGEFIIGLIVTGMGAALGLEAWKLFHPRFA